MYDIAAAISRRRRRRIAAALQPLHRHESQVRLSDTSTSRGFELLHEERRERADHATFDYAWQRKRARLGFDGESL